MGEAKEADCDGEDRHRGARGGRDGWGEEFDNQRAHALLDEGGVGLVVSKHLRVRDKCAFNELETKHTWELGDALQPDGRIAACEEAVVLKQHKPVAGVHGGAAAALTTLLVLGQRAVEDGDSELAQGRSSNGSGCGVAGKVEGHA